MPNTLLRWSFGNNKLKRTRTVSFGLPAYRSADGFPVCPMAGTCAGYCYARQGRYTLPESQATRELNLAIARQDLATFERFAVADLHKITQQSIRIHDSGDFFSQAYLDTWFRIVRQFPRKRFYCYTKSIHLDWSQHPANLRMTQSIGGKLDARIDQTQSHTRVFASVEDRRRAGYLDGNQTDRPVMRGEIKIGLVYHGTRKLTPAQERYLKR